MYLVDSRLLYFETDDEYDDKLKLSIKIVKKQLKTRETIKIVKSELIIVDIYWIKCS